MNKIIKSGEKVSANNKNEGIETFKKKPNNVEIFGYLKMGELTRQPFEIDIDYEYLVELINEFQNSLTDNHKKEVLIALRRFHVPLSNQKNITKEVVNLLCYNTGVIEEIIKYSSGKFAVYVTIDIQSLYVHETRFFIPTELSIIRSFDYSNHYSLESEIDGNKITFNLSNKEILLLHLITEKGNLPTSPFTLSNDQIEILMNQQDIIVDKNWVGKTLGFFEFIDVIKIEYLSDLNHRLPVRFITSNYPNIFDKIITN